MFRFGSLVFFVALLGVRLDVTYATIKVDVYLEALCPYCQDFVTKNLKTYYDAGLWGAMDLHMYYSGNAELARAPDGENLTLTCQHGERECFLNKVIGCGISRFSKSEDWFPFVYCMEAGVRNALDVSLTSKPSLRWFDAWQDTTSDSNGSDDDDLIKSCCKKVGLKKKDIMRCAKSREGEEIQLAAYEAFAFLDIPATGVPWVVANGVPTEYLPHTLTYYLCEEFDKYHRPPICKDVWEANDLALHPEHEMSVRYEVEA